MKKKWIFFVAPPAIVVFVALFGEIVKWLWNWLLPALFGWHAITFWQALGLLTLSRILFGGWGGPGPDRSKSRRRCGPGWVRLTPEELEQTRHTMRSHGGGFEPPATGANNPS